MILLVVLVLLSIVAIFYLYITAKSRERLALIEKGMNPNLSRSDFWPQVGIIAAGSSFGLMVSDFLPFRAGLLLVFLFPGIGLVIYHMVRRSKM